MQKYPYIDSAMSLSAHTKDIGEQLNVIASRYIGANAPLSYARRRVSADAFRQEGGVYVIDLAEKLGEGCGGYALVCGVIVSDQPREVELTLRCAAPVRLFLDKSEIFRSTFRDEAYDSPSHTLPVTLQPGRHVFTLLCRRTAAGFGARLGTPGTTLFSPFAERDGLAGWIWSELTDNISDETLDNTIGAAMRLAPEHETGLCFRPAIDSYTLTRAFYEGAFADKHWVQLGSSNYGRWDYPVGVTLQGLLRCADALDKPQIAAYARAHVDLCVDHYAQALRDRTDYGCAMFLRPLVAMGTLDDVGSMGSAMLECHRMTPREEYAALAGEIKDMIFRKISRLPDGTMYRQESGTIWADDLYMGTSFLRRYYELFDDRDCLDLAAEQFLLFARYLLREEVDLFAHVYDVNRKRSTGVSWGRGNGWVMYSLIELLEIMPRQHPRFDALLALLRRLCAGALRLQDARGYWHQVLTDYDSYEETSCTAMNLYTFCKAARLGFFDDPQPYLGAAALGWAALSAHSVDKLGNVHAVCKGSGFSFTEEYYKNDLYWITNDTHGIGIVLIAGCEYRACAANPILI